MDSRVLKRIGLAMIVAAAIAFLLSGHSQWVRWVAMFVVLAGVSAIRSGKRVGPSPSPSAGKKPAFPIFGVGLAALTALSFVWLLAAGAAGRHEVIDVWVSTGMTLLLLAYLFYLFILRRWRTGPNE